MCGRFTLTDPTEIEERFGFLDWHDRRPEPRFNIAPSQDVLIVTAGAGASARRSAALARWGFAPAWTADARAGARRPPPINARAESLVESPLFRDALAGGRCLIPADGFYEWSALASDRAKQPLHVRLRGERLFAFAGVWVPDAAGALTAAIITCPANALVATFHTRMPVILRREDEEVWLDPAWRDAVALTALLRPYPAEDMQASPVGSLVNAVANDGPALLEPPQASAAAQLSLF